VEVTYQLTADDFRHGMIAWRMKSRWRRWSYRFGLALMPPILILKAILLAAYPRAELRQAQWTGLGAAALWLTYIWAGPWLSARMQFRRMPSAQDPMTLAVSESGIRMQSRHSDSQVAWSAFNRLARGEIGFRSFSSAENLRSDPQTSLHRAAAS
jgi:hypothetical protein